MRGKTDRILDEELYKGCAAEIRKVVKYKKLDDHQDFMQGFETHEAEFHIIKSEDFNAAMERLKIIEQYEGRFRPSIRRIIKLISKDYTDDKEK